MALAQGTKVGVYEVVAFLGRGGMGEVYRAHDTKLHRDVALKVLPDSVATDPDRLARFEREAQVLAALNHPHIAAIYGMEESGPAEALVLELVDGATLADRIAAGPLSLDEARPIARQIAQALEAAHDQGIVHRDLKPANIKVRADGTVKVLDFGLAKALETPTHAEVSQSPTIASPALTQMGVLLGTAAYMSPELAKGRQANRQSDIWAFGCVLYEMLSGRRAFEGDHMTEVLGAVVRLEPDWQALPTTVPLAMQSVLKRCLQKDPALRMRDIADARFQLDDAVERSASFQAVTPADRRRWYSGWIAAAIVTVAGAVAVVVSNRPPAVPPETRLEIVTPPAVDPLALAISPDGRSLVFQAGQEPPRLWLRPLASQEARALMGTEGATQPFWSPDSRSVGFFADDVLKRIDLESGFVRTLAPAPGPRGGTWNGNGTILMGTGLGTLSSVPEGGGPLTPATRLLAEQTDHRWPQFLPGGDRFLLFATGALNVRGLYLGSLTNPNLRRVSDRELAYASIPPEHVLFARKGALWARRLTGQDMSGELVPLTSDGRHILYRLQTAENADLWALPLFGERKPFAITRTSFAEANGRFSPDDRWVAYQSAETGPNEIYVQPFLGTGPKLQISLSGGTQPRWGRGELFYLASDGQLMTVSVAPDGPRLRTSVPRALFKLPAVFGAYEPSSDGQRFLVNAIVSDASPITIVLNWKAPNR